MYPLGVGNSVEAVLIMRDIMGTELADDGETGEPGGETTNPSGRPSTPIVSSARRMREEMAQRQLREVIGKQRASLVRLEYETRTNQE